MTPRTLRWLASLTCLTCGCVEDRYLASLIPPGAAPWTLAHTVQGRREEEATRFGTAVAVDEAFVVVGLPNSSDCGGDLNEDLDCPGGKVAVYRRPLVPGLEPLVLSASQTEAALLGSSVAIGADRIWAGAPGHTPSQPSPGAVFEYLTADLPSPASALLDIGPAAAAGGRAGLRIALDPPWAAILAPFDTCPEDPNQEGTTHLYYQDEAGWIRLGGICEAQGAVPAESRVRNEVGSVAIGGERLFIGLPFGSESGDGGRVQIYDLFDRSGIVRAADIRLPQVANQPAGEFGAALTVGGDWLFVGAPGIDRVYVFLRSESTWALTQVLGDATDTGSRFGGALASWGEQLAVGAPIDEDCATGIDPEPAGRDCTDVGAAYVYVLDASLHWQRRHRIKPPQGGGRFGAAVAIRDDTLVVGAPSHSSFGRGVDNIQEIGPRPFGAVFVYERNDEQND